MFEKALQGIALAAMSAIIILSLFAGIVAHMELR